MVTTNFEDFYEVPNLNFDIPRLREDLELEKKVSEVRRLKNERLETKVNSMREFIHYRL